MLIKKGNSDMEILAVTDYLTSQDIQELRKQV